DHVVGDAATGRPLFDEGLALVLRGDDDVVESGVEQHRAELGDERGARHTSAVQTDVSADLVGQFGRRHDIGDRQTSTGTEHPIRVGEHRGLVRGQVDHTVGDDHVDGAVGDGQVFDLAEAELDVVVSA